MRIRIQQPNEPERVLTFASDRITIGRRPADDVEVVIAQPYVSGRHVRIFRGVVVHDLGSANGTFVDGQRIDAPTLLAGRHFSLGRDDVRIVIEDDPGQHTDEDDGFERTLAASESPAAARSRAVTPAPGDGELARVRDELEETRRARQRAESEAAKLRLELDSARGGDRSELEAERKRVRAFEEQARDLRRELEERAKASESDVNVRLAREELRALQQREAQSQARANELEARLATSERALAQARALPLSARQGDDALAVRVAELEAAADAARAAESKLRAELEVARKAALSAPAAAPVGAADLFMRLNAQNKDLRDKVGRLEAQAGMQRGPARPEPARSEPQPVPTSRAERDVDGERERLERRVRDLESELGAARAANASAVRPAASPARAVPAWPVASAGASASRLRSAFLLLTEADIESAEPPAGASAEEWLAFEALRFARRSEKLVTRFTGEVMQLYHAQTVLPDVQGNLRKLARALLDAPNDPEPRAELSAYVAEILRWMTAMFGAPRKAATELVSRLRSELTEESLAREKPVGGLLKVNRDAELWRRASGYLRDLTDETVEDRFDALARLAAKKLAGADDGTP